MKASFELAKMLPAAFVVSWAGAELELVLGVPAAGVELLLELEPLLAPLDAVMLGAMLGGANFAKAAKDASVLLPVAGLIKDH